jgi:hypothetical protein
LIKRRAASRASSVVERFLEVGRARVRPHEHGLVLERHARLQQRTCSLGHEHRLLLRRAAPAKLRLRPVGERRP